MIKISKLADYGVVVMAELAGNTHVRMTAANIAGHTKLPEPTVAKVLKILARHNLVSSLRGPSGGYQLTGSPDNITVRQIIGALDGPVALTACVGETDQSCELAECCGVFGRWDSVNMAVKNALDGITLADMMGPQNRQTGTVFTNTENKEGAVL